MLVAWCTGVLWQAPTIGHFNGKNETDTNKIFETIKLNTLLSLIVSPYCISNCNKFHNSFKEMKKSPG